MGRPRKYHDDEERKARKRAYNAVYHTENRGKVLARKAVYRKVGLIKGAAKRAKASGLEHSITPDDLHWPTHCPVLGIELNYDGGEGRGGKPNSPSLDRWNNEVGYTPHNTVVISWRANCLKKDGTLDELMRVAYYAKYGRCMPPPGLEDVWGD